MSIIARVLVIALCAYAGSAVASIQFPELPDCNQTDGELKEARGSSCTVPAVTTFSYGLSGITAFALVRSCGGDGYAYRTIHSLGRRIAACVAVRGKLVPSAIFGGANR